MVGVLSAALLMGVSVEHGEAARVLRINVAGCLDCDLCIPTTYHSTSAGDEVRGAEHPCIYATCNQPAHPPCKVEDEDLEDVDVEDAVAAFLSAEDSNELAYLMNRFRGAARYNPERRSIQLLACDLESVVANIPLTEAQIIALLD